jgi:adenine-specific DNA-methyltransferase
MNDFQTKQAIQQALQTIDRQGLKASGLALLGAMGYRSDKRLELSPNTPAEFISTFGLSGKLNAQRALLDQWQTVDLLDSLPGTPASPAAQTTKRVRGL